MCKVVKQVKEVVYENLPSAKQTVIFQGAGAIGAYADWSVHSIILLDKKGYENRRKYF